jgi:hypothetical protein
MPRKTRRHRRQRQSDNRRLAQPQDTLLTRPERRKGASARFVFMGNIAV